MHHPPFNFAYWVPHSTILIFQKDTQLLSQFLSCICIKITKSAESIAYGVSLLVKVASSSVEKVHFDHVYVEADNLNVYTDYYYSLFGFKLGI